MNPPALTEHAPTVAVDESYVLRLFVSGTTLRSSTAIVNLKRLCEERLTGHYTLEVVDIYQHPEAAREHQIVAVPTLLKLLPTPVRRIIGDLSDTDRVLRALNMELTAPTPHRCNGGE